MPPEGSDSCAGERAPRSGEASRRAAQGVRLACVLVVWDSP